MSNPLLNPLRINDVHPSAVYYRLYTEDGAIRSKTNFDAYEDGLGRIPILNIAPPHTPDSIKRSISRAEDDPALINAVLYAEILSESPMEHDFVPNLSSSGPGLSAHTPLAIVKSYMPAKPRITLRAKAQWSR